MTIETLKEDARSSGRVVKSFKLPRATSTTGYVITEVPAEELPEDPLDPRTHADTYVVSDEEGHPQIVIGIQPSERWGAYVGLAPLEDGAVDPELVREAVRDVLEVAQVQQAVVPPEANGLGKLFVREAFGAAPNFAGMIAVSGPMVHQEAA